ncbi:MAG: dephospho-CoA kinase [Lewinellaceae bacterium]|nr:dephospho-CoA kinase [Saprospiraceae bacterium]MCB9342575.1 dephospho-CoA kinase [Lewinellaceae bacterium]
MKGTEKSSYRVGITGGIGSGKSTVCKIFETLGIPVYDADYWAKWLIQHDPNVKTGIKQLLGEQAYAHDETYDRAYVASIVFNDPIKLGELNKLVHPVLEEHAKAWHLEKSREGALYTLKEAALLIESGSYKHLDYLILVTAPEELRIARVVKRDSVSAEQVMARIKQQLPENEKKQFANTIINNDEKHSLVKQVWECHHEILGIMKSKD